MVATKKVEVTASETSHIPAVVRALLASGWATSEAPRKGRLLRNRQKIILKGSQETRRFRLLVFKVTKSSRGNDYERRVEITSTYGARLQPEPEFDDVVLGYDPQNEVFVGLDPERLRHGGPTSNASSFLEASGLNRTADEPFVVLSRVTQIFPEGEHQAFFRPERLMEYLFNISAVHTGSYPGRGRGSAETFQRARWLNASLGEVASTDATGDTLVLHRGSSLRRAKAALTAQARTLLDEPRHALITRRITPEELRAILLVQEQNGLLGEEVVYKHERDILRKARRPDLADRVKWVSRTSVGEGYDISSFDPGSGEPRYIEVKSGHRKVTSFEITANEWRKAESLGDRYFIYCVSYVRTKVRVHVLRDPCALVRESHLRMDATSWRVRWGTLQPHSCHGNLDAWAVS